MSCSSFRRIDDSGLKSLAGAVRAKLRRAYSSHLLAVRSKASLEYAVPGKSLAVKGGLRLHELEGGTEVTPSRRLEVIGRLGAIGCWRSL